MVLGDDRKSKEILWKREASSRGINTLNSHVTIEHSQRSHGPAGVG